MKEEWGTHGSTHSYSVALWRTQKQGCHPGPGTPSCWRDSIAWPQRGAERTNTLKFLRCWNTTTLRLKAGDPHSLPSSAEIFTLSFFHDKETKVRGRSFYQHCLCLMQISIILSPRLQNTLCFGHVLLEVVHVISAPTTGLHPQGRGEPWFSWKKA